MQKGRLTAPHDKPSRPKEATEEALKEARIPRSSSIYQQLGEKVSLVRCVDPAFNKLKTTLKNWFSLIEARSPNSVSALGPPPTSSFRIQMLQHAGDGADVLVAPALGHSDAVEVQEHLAHGHRGPQLKGRVHDEFGVLGQVLQGKGRG